METNGLYNRVYCLTHVSGIAIDMDTIIEFFVTGGKEKEMEFQYQLFPDLTQEEYKALKDDIRQRGILVPVEIDDSGNILDGHHRIKAWNELKAEGVSLPDYVKIIRKFENEAEKRNHVRALNILRRHLSKEQAHDQWQAMRLDGMTYQAIADASGVDKTTVIRTVGANALTQPTTITGKDGKQYPPTKKLQSAPQETVFDLVKVKTVKQKNKEKKAKDRKKQLSDIVSTMSEIPKSEKYKIYQADINTVALDRQFDFIITDPPYPKEYLYLYEVLARRATEWLKDDGLLVVMAGNNYINSIYSILDKYLNYYWTGCYYTPGSAYSDRIKKVNSFWKPILIYSVGDYKGKVFSDVYKSELRDKDFHEWGQSLSGMDSIVKQICDPGKTILDPFLGGGTTALAAINNNCYFEGFDIEVNAVKLTASRLV